MKVKTPRSINSDLAEICGIHAGDGYLRNDGMRIELDISGNLDEANYYNHRVSSLFKRVFGIKIKCRYFPHRRTYGFVVRNRRIVEFFHMIGFPYGKKESTVKVPDSILRSKDKKIISSFIRGIFDTDGCLNFDRKYGKNYRPFRRLFHFYPRILLCTVSKSLSNNLCYMLGELGLGYYLQTCKPKRERTN